MLPWQIDISSEIIHPKHQRIFEPIHEEWPSPFINYYFPVHLFDEDKLDEDGFVGLAISVEAVEPDSQDLWLQKELGLNLINSFGKFHPIFGIYVKDKKMVSQCFMCSLTSDGCLCKIGEKKKKSSTIVNFKTSVLSIVSFDTCY